MSNLLNKIKQTKDLNLDNKSLYKLIIWMDVYAQKEGSFCNEQENDLIILKDKVIEEGLVKQKKRINKW